MWLQQVTTSTTVVAVSDTVKSVRAACSRSVGNLWQLRWDETAFAHVA